MPPRDIESIGTHLVALTVFLSIMITGGPVGARIGSVFRSQDQFPSSTLASCVVSSLSHVGHF